MYSLIIVDDENLTRMAISGYLQKKQTDFKVLDIFSSANLAIKFMQSNPVDVVITDIRMSGMDGLEFAKYISEHFTNTVVIIISGYGEFEYARKAILYGVNSYLLKPIDFEELSSTLCSIKKKLDTMYRSYPILNEDEDVQLFFTDLISGAISSREMLDTRFNALDLSNTSGSYKGHLLSVTMNTNELSTWNYGKEKLASELHKSIKEAFPNLLTYHLFRSGPKYFFIVMSEIELPQLSLEILENVIYHFLHFNVKLNISITFHTISELGMFHHKSSSIEHTIAAATAPSLPPVEKEDAIIQRAISYMQANYAKDLTRRDVAEAVFLSSSYFSRFFKENTGMTFIDYLTLIRMQKAEQLLETNLKIGEIASKVGYQTSNRFVVNFREYSGYTPTEYRIQLLKKANVSE